MSTSHSATQSSPQTPAPQQALARLIEGNERFTRGLRSVEGLLAHSKMADLAKNGQRPFAIVLTCSDSRAPVEMIFDQGLGDLFVVRVAGNVVAPSLLASIEFAAANFGSSLVLVLGHSLCGAVKATIEHHKNHEAPLPSPHLEELVGRIRPAIERAEKECALSDPHFLDRSTVENVKRSMRLVQEQSQIIQGLVKEGKLAIAGGVLDISTGKVNLL
jgi:carbonic anhydrase